MRTNCGFHLVCGQCGQMLNIEGEPDYHRDNEFGFRIKVEPCANCKFEIENKLELVQKLLEPVRKEFMPLTPAPDLSPNNT